MIKSYLKTAWRNMMRHKVYSAINILGLAIGIAACLLILQYVSFELGYENFEVNNQPLKIQKAYFASPSFFNIFTYPLLGGDKNTALKDPFTVALSETTA